RAVLLPAQVGEQPGVHRRVQRLDPPVQALREGRHVLHPGDRDTGRGERGRGGTGGDDLHAGGVQGPGQFVQPPLVVHTDQGAPDRSPGHGMVTFLPVMVQPSRTSRPTTATSWRRSATWMRSVRVSTVSSSSTGTATWATIGPVSTPASTKNRVAPVTFTP